MSNETQTPTIGDLDALDLSAIAAAPKAIKASATKGKGKQGGLNTSQFQEAILNVPSAAYDLIALHNIREHVTVYGRVRSSSNHALAGHLAVVRRTNADGSTDVLWAGTGEIFVHCPDLAERLKAVGIGSVSALGALIDGEAPGIVTVGLPTIARTI